MRGDLSKWLCEINTGVYIGHVSSRVRDALWERISLHLKNGRATLVYTTDGEQRLAFRVHNTPWQPVDLDGVTLMRRPLPNAVATGALPRGYSNAAQRLIAQRTQTKRRTIADYVAIDLETTGLNSATDRILEYGAVKIQNGRPTQSFACLVRQTVPIPPTIATLTHLNDATIAAKGRSPEQALKDFLTFIGDFPLLGYNVVFDLAFIHAACKRYACQPPTNQSIDLLAFARDKCPTLPNHRLETLAQHFGLPQPPHRALQDALLTHKLNLKLNE